jgi:acyl-CoA thioesterase-1
MGSRVIKPYKTAQHDQKQSIKQPLLTLLALMALAVMSSSVSAANSGHNILVLGDSLSAGYGIEEQQGWVQLLRNRLQAQKSNQTINVVNASVSGETSAGANARLPKLLTQHQPHIVIVELGGNDGLRGYPLKTMQQQLQQIIDRSHRQNAKVLLLGMQIPPNYGKRYTRLFSNTYQTLAEKNPLKFVPFFLDQIATDPTQMQADGIHPVASAQAQMLDNVWPQLEAMLIQPPGNSP